MTKKKGKKSRPINQQNKQLKTGLSRYFPLILLVIGCVLFLPTSNFDFVNIDDNRLIYENPVVTDEAVSYSNCFTALLYTVHYKPLVFLSWKIENQLFGPSPWHFHLFNALLHILNALLVYLIGLRLFDKKYKQEIVFISSFMLGLLFLVHPMKIESVAWATERKDVLFGFFFLLSWLSYIKYIVLKKQKYLIVGALLFLCCGLSKSMGLPLLAVLFLTDYYFGRGWSKKIFIEKVAYFFAFLGLIYLYGIIDMGQVDTALTTLSDEAPTFTQGYLDQIHPILQWPISAAMRFYLWIIHLALPFELSIAYPHDKIFRFFGPILYIFPVLFIVMIGFLWRMRRHKDLAFSLLFFIISLSPALALNDVGNGVFLSDRYTYIPSIGFFYLLVIFINRIKKKKTRHAIFIGLSLAFTLLTIANLGHWKNSKTLFEQALNVDNESALAHLNLGNYYLHQGDFDQALKYYTEGVRYNEGFVKLYVSRSRVYLEKRQLDNALADLNTCLSMTPDFVEALVNRGSAYGLKKEYTKALKDLNRALELSPRSSDARMNRSIVHFNRQDYQSSLQDNLIFLELNPNDVNALNTVGICHNALGQFDQAIVAFNQAIQLDNTNATFYYNRSLAYLRKGNKNQALQDATEAQRLGYPVEASYLNSLR